MQNTGMDIYKIEQKILNIKNCHFSAILNTSLPGDSKNKCLHVDYLAQIQNILDVCHKKTDLKVFVVVLPKEGLAGWDL